MRFRPGVDDKDKGEQPSLSRAVSSAPTKANPLNVLFFARLCESKGVPRPEQEYVFHPTRKYRFDLAWKKEKVALEVHGAVFQKGGHNSPAGTQRDWEKANEGQLLGWIVIQVGRSVGGKESWLSLDTVDLVARAIARQKVRNG